MDWGAFLIKQINILPIHSKPILRPFMKPYPRHCAINYTKVGESGGEWTLSTPTERLRPLHPHPLSIPSSSPWLSFIFSLTYFITALDDHLASRCITRGLAPSQPALWRPLEYSANSSRTSRAFSNVPSFSHPRSLLIIPDLSCRFLGHSSTHFNLRSSVMPPTAGHRFTTIPAIALLLRPIYFCHISFSPVLLLYAHCLQTFLPVVSSPPGTSLSFLFSRRRIYPSSNSFDSVRWRGLYPHPYRCFFYPVPSLLPSLGRFPTTFDSVPSFFFALSQLTLPNLSM